MNDLEELAYRTKAAAETLADLEKAVPIDGAEDACQGIAKALDRMADDLTATQPHATVTINRYRAAAETVRAMLDDLADEVDL